MKFPFYVKNKMKTWKQGKISLESLHIMSCCEIDKLSKRIRN